MITPTLQEFNRDLHGEVAQAVAMVIDAAENRLILSRQLASLKDSLAECYPERFGGRAALEVDDPEYGPGFDVSSEINAQIKMVRTLRAKLEVEISTNDSKTTSRDMKEAIAAGSSMMSTLMKYHKEIVNQDRLRMVEEATIEAVKSLPEEHQTEFFRVLELHLAAKD